MHRLQLIRRAQAWNYQKRRVQVLGTLASSLIPTNSSVLDIGCGDGSIDHQILESRPDVSLQGCDLVSWPEPKIDVMIYGGLPLPFETHQFDCAMLIDVVHHAGDPSLLLREAARVSRQCIILKDHLTDRWMARPILEFMDRIGNENQGVSLPFAYWAKREWLEEFEIHNLVVDSWLTDVPIYPWWAAWLFGKGLHFVARIVRA